MQKAWIRWSLFVLLAIVWGSSFLIMKRGLRTFSYEQLGALRIVFAWLLATLLAAKHLKKFSKENAKPLFWVGILGNGIPYYLFPLAITRLPSGLVGIFNSLVPLFTLITGYLLFNKSFRKVQVIGVFIGLSGAALLLFPNAKIEWNPNLAFGGLAIISTICYALSINVISSKLQSLNSLAITALSLAYVGIPSLIYLFSTDFLHRMATSPLAWEDLGYAAFLGMVNSALAIIVFNQLIKITSPLFSSSVTYFIPMVALMWGVIDGEPIGWIHLLGILTILTGVYLVNVYGYKKRRQAELDKLQAAK